MHLYIYFVHRCQCIATHFVNVCECKHLNVRISREEKTYDHQSSTQPKHVNDNSCVIINFFVDFDLVFSSLHCLYSVHTSSKYPIKSLFCLLFADVKLLRPVLFLNEITKNKNDKPIATQSLDSFTFSS